MNFDDYLQTIEDVRVELIDNQPERVLRVSNLFLALIKDRIQRTGVNYEGNQFEAYTTPYAKRRQDGGYQTEYVDFTVTGRLWANIVPQAEVKQRGVTEVTIKARDAENQAKLNGQFEKRGNILLGTEEEIDFLTQQEQREIQKILSKL